VAITTQLNDIVVTSNNNNKYEVVPLHFHSLKRFSGHFVNILSVSITDSTAHKLK